MKIVMLAVGTRGDVQPYIALGRGLKAAGHDVLLATHTPFEDFVRLHGLDFMPLNANPQAILESEIGKSWLESGRNLFGFLRTLREMGDDLMEQLNADIWKASQGAEAIIYSTLAMSGHFAAMKLGVPRFVAPLQPLSRTRDYPNIFFPRNLSLGRRYNYFTHLMTEELIWLPVRRQVNRWIRNDLGLQPVSWRGPYPQLKLERTPVLYGYSPKVVPPASDWPEWHHVTGYWTLPPSENWQPPDGLVDFLQSGPAPVYIGFGSMTNRNPEEGADVALEALRQSGQRGLLLRGWGGLSKSDLPADVFMVDSIPHHWLFPRMAAVVHHGGAGTTGAGLRSGVPSIIIPHFSDQPYWGERVHELGVGPKPIPRKDLTAKKLGHAIKLSIEDDAMRKRAVALGSELQKEDGIATAIKIIEDNLN
jgi:sterol 3beta-glucosyltransferase